MSDLFIEKALPVFFKDITRLGLFKTALNWCIDSKFRRYKSVSIFLKEQIDYINENYLNDPQAMQAYNIMLSIKHKSKTPDDFMVNCCHYVWDLIGYKTDKLNWGKDEYWATLTETLLQKYDDCDGINGAIYVLASLAGVFDLGLWCSIGQTINGGHFWVLYYSTTYEKLVSIDATFYPDFTTMRTRKPFKITKEGYTSLEYIFNENETYIPI